MCVIGGFKLFQIQYHSKLIQLHLNSYTPYTTNNVDTIVLEVTVPVFDKFCQYHSTKTVMLYEGVLIVYGWVIFTCRFG